MEKKLRELIKQAMLEKNTEKKQTYKNILETAQKIAKEKKTEVTDSLIFDAAKKEIKQINDLLAYVKETDDKYTVLVQNKEYAESILPKMVSEQEILDFLTSNNIDKNMGTCMKALKAEFKDSLNGKLASQTVRKYLG